MLRRILQWNVRGLKARSEDLKVLLSETNPECLCLQELKLPDVVSAPKFDRNYNTYFRLPLDNTHSKGGVMIAVKKNIQHTQLPLNTTLQAVAVTIHGQKIKSLCSIYLPPAEIIEIDKLLDIVSQLPKPTLLMGDFNAHSPLWYDARQDHRGILVEQLIALENLVCLNNDHPTYFNTHGGTLVNSNIDLALISNTCATYYTWTALDDLHGSDHYPLMLSSLHPPPKNYNKKWCLDRADWSLFSESVLLGGEPRNFDTVEAMYEHFKQLINSAANTAIPRTSVTLKRPPVPWWNQDCKNQRSAVRSAYRQMKRNPSQTTINIYRRRLALKTRSYRKAKINSWKQYVSNLNAKTPSTKVWQRIKKINGHYSLKPTPTLLINGKMISSPKEVANTLAQHYSAVSTGPLPLMQQQQRHQASNHQNYNKEFTLKELNGAINQAKNKSSPGEDHIHNNMLKHLPAATRTLLLNIFNRIWLEGVIPEEWRVSIVVPILKSGKNPADPKSYRPISLTSSVCKILEKMINLRLVWFLEKHHLLTPHQYGFRQNRNTIDPIARLTTDILDGFSIRQSTTAIFFDIEKAFDTINRVCITSSLREMGIEGRMLNFIENYLENRSLKVSIGDVLSDPYPTNIGVPQGGVLSVTCFTVAINSILNKLPKQVKSSLYADDLVIYHTTLNPNTSIRQLQLAIRSLEGWTLRSGLRFSPTKSEVVCFQRSGRRRIVPDILPQLYNQPIPIKETTKFLGMTLDRRLNWVPHLKALKSETLRSLNILRVVTRVNFGPDKKTLMRLYWAICQSKLNYGAQIYSSAKPIALKILDSAHNEALRLITGAFRTSPVASLQVQAESPPLELQRDSLCLKYFMHVQGSADYKTTMNVIEDQNDETYRNNDKLQTPIGVKCRQLLQSVDFTPNPIPRGPSEVAPWLMDEVRVCYHGIDNTKKLAGAPHLLQAFLSHMPRHSNSEHIYTDGSKTAEGVGFGVVWGPNLTSCRRGSLPKEATIFTAELHAILLALSVTVHSPERYWTIFTDSQSSLMSIEASYPQHPLVQAIQSRLFELLEQHKTIEFCKVPSHIGVRGNEAVDRVANEAIHIPGFASTQIPHRDYFQGIKRTTQSRWQERWNQANTHLKRLKPSIKPWNKEINQSRKAETKIARLRIGHTRLTHAYYMSRTRPPECMECGTTPLTVQHILIDCPAYQAERINNKITNNYQTILGESCPISNVLSFLDEICILEEI